MLRVPALTSRSTCGRTGSKKWTAGVGRSVVNSATASHRISHRRQGITDSCDGTRLSGRIRTDLQGTRGDRNRRRVLLRRALGSVQGPEAATTSMTVPYGQHLRPLRADSVTLAAQWPPTACRTRPRTSRTGSPPGRRFDKARCCGTSPTRPTAFTTLTCRGTSGVAARFPHPETGLLRAVRLGDGIMLASQHPGPGGGRFTQGTQVRDQLPISSHDAHAWVEVLFDRYGWIQFDPTPLGAVGVGGEASPRPGRPSRAPSSGAERAPVAGTGRSRTRPAAAPPAGPGAIPAKARHRVAATAGAARDPARQLWWALAGSCCCWQQPLPAPPWSGDAEHRHSAGRRRQPAPRGGRPPPGGRSRIWPSITASGWIRPSRPGRPPTGSPSSPHLSDRGRADLQHRHPGPTRLVGAESTTVMVDDAPLGAAPRSIATDLAHQGAALAPGPTGTSVRAASVVAGSGAWQMLARARLQKRPPPAGVEWAPDDNFGGVLEGPSRPRPRVHRHGHSRQLQLRNFSSKPRRTSAAVKSEYEERGTLTGPARRSADGSAPPCDCPATDSTSTGFFFRALGGPAHSAARIRRGRLRRPSSRTRSR